MLFGEGLSFGHSATPALPVLLPEAPLPDDDGGALCVAAIANDDGADATAEAARRLASARLGTTNRRFFGAPLMMSGRAADASGGMRRCWWVVCVCACRLSKTDQSLEVAEALGVTPGTTSHDCL